MSRRGRGVRADSRERVEAREEIEREYRDSLEVDDSLAPLVTGEEAAREPWHRWLPYRQKFSPGLVRRFLKGAKGPVLDPFGGSGTTLIAAAQAGVRAVSVEAVPVLAFLADARFRPSSRARRRPASTTPPGRKITNPMNKRPWISSHCAVAAESTFSR